MKISLLTAMRALALALPLALFGLTDRAAAQTAEEQPPADATADEAAAEVQPAAEAAADATAGAAADASADVPPPADASVDASATGGATAGADVQSDAQTGAPPSADALPQAPPADAAEVQAGASGQAEAEAQNDPTRPRGNRGQGRNGMRGNSAQAPGATQGDPAQAGAQPDGQQPNGQQPAGQQGGGQQNGAQQNIDLGVQFGAPTGRGLTLNAITQGSELANAGLRQRDVIVSIAGQPVRSGVDFQRFVLLHPGQRVPVIVFRGGRQETIFITPPAHWANRAPQSAGLLGVSLDFRIPNAAIVRYVTPQSPADQIGISPGDMIYAVNGERIASPHDLTRAIARMQPGDRADISFSRRAEVVLGSQPVRRNSGYAPQPYGR